MLMSTSPSPLSTSLSWKAEVSLYLKLHGKVKVEPLKNLWVSCSKRTAVRFQPKAGGARKLLLVIGFQHQLAGTDS